jgi:hypothetical protein
MMKLTNESMNMSSYHRVNTNQSVNESTMTIKRDGLS